MDIVSAAVGLVCFAPVMAVASCWVKLDSHGPVIYRQQRIGRGGRPFTLYKLRSMYVTAEEQGPQLSRPGDPRVTTSGRFLRRFHVDELPQLWNVLRGDMSIVGPRPERQVYVDQLTALEPSYRRLQSLRPGLTSWGNVSYGYATTLAQMRERMVYDIYYLDHLSPWMDARVLWRTVVHTLSGKGV